ncbi:MAG: hypothetical protein ACOC2W_02130 [bacterium]
MKKLFLISLMLVIVLLVGCSNDNVGVDEFNVSGSIVDEYHKPMENVTIHVEEFGTATTNEHGTWSKSSLEGIVTITPAKEGVTFTPSQYNVNGDNENLNSINFVGEYENDSGQGLTTVSISRQNTPLNSIMSLTDSNSGDTGGIIVNPNSNTWVRILVVDTDSERIVAQIDKEFTDGYIESVEIPVPSGDYMVTATEFKKFSDVDSSLENYRFTSNEESWTSSDKFVTSIGKEKGVIVNADETTNVSLELSDIIVDNVKINGVNVDNTMTSEVANGERLIAEIIVESACELDLDYSPYHAVGLSKFYDWGNYTDGYNIDGKKIDSTLDLFRLDYDVENITTADSDINKYKITIDYPRKNFDEFVNDRTIEYRLSININEGVTDDQTTNYDGHTSFNRGIPVIWPPIDEDPLTTILRKPDSGIGS